MRLPIYETCNTSSTYSPVYYTVYGLYLSVLLWTLIAGDSLYRQPTAVPVFAHMLHTPSEALPDGIWGHSLWCKSKAFSYMWWYRKDAAPTKQRPMAAVNTSDNVLAVNISSDVSCCDLWTRSGLRVEHVECCGSGAGNATCIARCSSCYKEKQQFASPCASIHSGGVCCSDHQVWWV